jgi:hypothetical protein
MSFREMIPVYSENHTKPINTLYGQNTKFVNDEAGGTYSDHWALKGLIRNVKHPIHISKFTNK